MHQEINSPDINKVYTCVFRPVKAQCSRFMSMFLGRVYQFVLMKENVHRGAHALTTNDQPHVCSFGNNVLITER